MLQRSYNDEFLVSAWVTYHLFENKWYSCRSSFMLLFIFFHR
ncbi:hypothetical protein Mpsy_1695 [Methanolobus psychrophilus R15]|nr:hypothetical protein Mpsy_1695 [Methanolobus psychrophilus R15]